MRVDTLRVNPSFQSLINNPEQDIFLDANFLIPPDRSHFGMKPYRFEDYREFWLEPLFSEFDGLSIHESVYDELVMDNVKQYADFNINDNKSSLRVHYDSELSETECIIMMTYIDSLAIHSQYDPDIDNSKDRGEIRSLSYMAVKNYLYFSANDDLPIRLIKNADSLNTGLDNMGVIQMYEIIYYLYKKGCYDGKALRNLYKYQYYLTPKEKQQNPNWGDFVRQMDELYSGGF